MNRVHRAKNIIVCMFLMIAISFTSAAFALDDVYMSNDSVFDEAYESYEKGIRDEARGDKAFRGRPGEAQRRYEHAEDYYLNAAFIGLQ